MYIMYLNGCMVKSTNGANITIGNYVLSIGSSKFAGNVTDIRVYSRVLSPMEISMVWNIGVVNIIGGLVDNYGMVCYYKWDYGSVSVI